MNKFIEEFIDLFPEPPSGLISELTDYKSLPEWDSLFALSMIVMISDNYGKSINGDIIKSLKTIGDLYNYVTLP